MMRTPEPIWETTYAHDRRKHRHRCMCCNRILNAGEPVIQARMGRRGEVRTIHLACGDRQHGGANWTWRDALRFWGTEHLRAVGFKVPLPPSGQRFVSAAA